MRARVLGGLLAAGGYLLCARAVRSPEPWETGQTANDILAAPTWPSTFPLTAAHLSRLDESDDQQFYAQPRLVQHIDEYAVRRLQQYYKDNLPRGGHVLDLMSSWTSHLAEGSGKNKQDGHFGHVSGVGMHAAELARNEALSDFHVHDLNQAPTLPMYADASFDAVFCSVSVDYLSRPLEVFAEIHRILKPGGLAVFTWSNRMFPTKAISAWRQASEPARLWIAASYFRYSVPGGFTPAEGADISPHPGRSDPLYVVSARKAEDALPAEQGRQQPAEARKEEL